MLTSTYSLVAIGAEQDKARSMLGRLKQYFQATWRGLQGFDFAFLETAFNKLVQFDKFCRNRKIELYLIPAMHGVSQEAEALIEEIEALSAKAARLLHFVSDHLAGAFDLGSAKVNEVFHAMESYCEKISMRIDREEKELLPLAQRLFSIEDWFSIAAKFLAEDAAAFGRRRQVIPARVSAPPRASALNTR
ncbi:MAG TPA: hypothetical protein VJ698_08365 [Noviherbaspirillum sp.]|uniref:hypothetical protein n=1 Tax=Noviherbaspirillum sp. TaxID=1926288 RepID=UPI002B48422C|nr:hypothetical protein [Noviherbaspirillum sp.]HJV85480.1 hypothetical protein [Noviherbaspirillum sp.]